MATHPNTIKKWRKVQKSFAAFSDEKSGITVKGINTPKYTVKQAIQKTATKHDLSFERVEKIIKMKLD